MSCHFSVIYHPLVKWYISFWVQPFLWVFISVLWSPRTLHSININKETYTYWFYPGSRVCCFPKVFVGYLLFSQVWTPLSSPTETSFYSLTSCVVGNCPDILFFILICLMISLPNWFLPRSQALLEFKAKPISLSSTQHVQIRSTLLSAYCVYCGLKTSIKFFSCLLCSRLCLPSP